ncbi:uncharacterized protein LOC101738884 isoform X1 [Bombyx mori]|uniref:MBD domain-containing protein n=1 Tax=Bombyx mori TaxID=7091 RepID=A0A8R2M3Q0_BOMMO|nr:uncharacterized protein LOC101738884 isoform X2 [Bombyx mori]
MSDEMAVIDNGGTEETNTESIEKVDTDVERSLEAKEVHKDHTELIHSDEPSNSQEETDSTEDSKLEIVEDNLEKQESVPSTEPNVSSNITEPKNTEPEPITELDTKALDAVSETQVADQKIFDEDVNETHPQIPELQVHVETDVKTPEMEVDENIEDKIEFETEMLKRDTDDSCKEGEKLEDIIAEVNKGIKRRASDAFGDENDEEFKGFDTFEDIKTEVYGRVVARLEAEVSAAIKNFTPVRNVIATPTASKRPRTDTDGSRPSSAMSSKSDENTDSVPSSPAQRRRATIDMSSPALRLPLERGWKRELVYRAALDSHSRKHGDIYYYTPLGKKLRSTREVSEQLAGTGLTLENFSFFKEPLGVDDPDKEIIRDAKLMRRVESPVCSAPPAVEGKRTPKPKPPKGASPEPVALTSPPAKIKVKSVGSRLSGSIPVPAAAPEPRKLPKKPQPQQPAPTTPSNADNNNTAAWKKPSEDKRRGRLANGAPPPAPAAAPPNSPRRRRARADVTHDADHFAPFYSAAQERNYNVVVQIFQYLGMRDLARCARVCKLWRQLAAAPALWRHVRMKNSHVSDWAGLCAALKRNGTKRLDLRKMLLPQNDAEFWDQFAEHIGTVDTIERIELCRCPARAVEAVCRAVPGLRSLAALAIRDALLDPAPLAALSRLHELRLKSMTGLSLTRDLSHLAALTSLQHLSLTSIKALGWCACEVVSALPALESLELGECTFRADFPAALSRLTRLRRLRLERGTAHAASPPTLRALAALPHLTSLELVNVDVKVGFDDALAECKNIQRLLIIPTYVSQSATTNKQVLSGVLRLKETLTHLMWGVTIELLRVTELFIDQCKQAGDAKRRELGECIPVLKPVPGCRLPPDHPHVAGPPQVEILPLPTLQRLLSAQLPNTKLKLLRIPFHATWRQSLADFQ